MVFAGHNSKKITVLVVDDTPEIQRYLRVILELDSHRVETAGSGPEALQCLGRVHAPEVVLLDVQMPEMDGFETLRRMQELRPKPKVIMCSGEDDPSKVHQAFALGAHAYLLKPVRHLYLSAAIERCLETPAKRPPESLGAQIFLLPSPSRGQQSPISGALKSGVESCPRGIA
jgi:CheY-like chemotaxis protein